MGDVSGADVTFLVAGLALILALIVPTLVSRMAVSSPIVLLAAGVAIGLTPLAEGLSVDPRENRAIVEHVTELTVIVALMGVGLAIDRPFSLRNRRTWRAWSPTARLLLVAMPLTIAGVAGLGLWAGLALPVAVLLGAALAPTDPVLASDVQVGAPDVESGEEQADDRSDGERSDDDDEPGGDEDSEVRFALTSEAAFNDGLAFPFVYLAVVLAAGGSLWSQVGEWVGLHLLLKVVVGCLVGYAVGAVLAKHGFRSRAESVRIAERGDPLLALAALLTAYGLAEVAQGYGFLSVVVCAMAMRAAERHHHFHRGMHELIERLELLLTLLVLLFLGIAIGGGLLGDLTWWGAAIGLALVFVIRPLAGWVSLALHSRAGGRAGGLRSGERIVVAFFGVRGVGSVYYLAYGLAQIETDRQLWLWATVAFTIVLSVVVHGVLATPVMRRVEEAPAA